MTGAAAPPDYVAARESLAHRVRAAGVLDVEGADRAAFLQGQLTQDVRSLAPGQVLPTAGLTPKGKLLYVARVIGLPDRIRLLVPAGSRLAVLEHLNKYAVFQKVTIADRSEDFVRIGLLGPEGPRAAAVEPPALLLPGEGEFSAEILAPAAELQKLEAFLRGAGSRAVTPQTAEALRIEAGRPRFGSDADSSNLPDEVGLDAAISTTKGCYVGQEIVARMRTYGRANRRLVGFRFPDGAIAAGSLLKLPDEAVPGKVEQGRVTSSAVSPAFGPIGLGYAFREVPVGARVIGTESPERSAIVAALPFSE